jgi:TRAP-type mannitol/chloroaromatic compound transport system permease small subunit
MSAPLSQITPIIRALDRFSEWAGRLVAWLIFPMVLSLVYEVIARYFFNAPTVWAYDMTYMLYGAFFMLGAGFTLKRGGHIRTDMFYARWSPRVRAIVDIACYLLLFFPPLIALFWVGSDFFLKSFERGERVVSSPWMPVIYPLKAAIPLACLLLMVQGLAELARSIATAIHGTEAPGRGTPEQAAEDIGLV